ncbi:hypothetical protein Tco_0750790 [Tanacetum coccineum]|uniref:Uncharacterized protein n=1 Tax=Tanacetum coccineum TaxID=301880 RepID=A0ABQ4Z273_9ASTR
MGGTGLSEMNWKGGIRVLGRWEWVGDSCRGVLGRWFGLKPWGSGGLGFGGKAVVARILELKRRNIKKTDSDIQYAVSIKEDTAYLCLHFTKDHEGNKINTPYPENPIRRIQVIECEDSGRYQTWSLLQEIPNAPY